MADQPENSAPLTAKSRKRTAGEIGPPPTDLATPPGKRLRVDFLEMLLAPASMVAGGDGPPRLPPLDIHRDSNDPPLCAQYASDIYQYHRSIELEQKRRPSPDYMQTVQTDLSAPMRGVVVDSLAKVAEEEDLPPNALYLAVSYMDRFLSGYGNAIRRQRLRLLGFASLLIAWKFVDRYSSRRKAMLYRARSDNKAEVMKAEAAVLKFLNYDIGNPTTETFLRVFVRAAQDDLEKPSLQLEFLGSYLAELSLLDYRCLRFLPSVVAASSVFIAKFTINPGAHPWNLNLQNRTGYKPSELKDCATAIHDLQLSNSRSASGAIWDKYSQHRFKSVAVMKAPTVIPDLYFEDVPPIEDSCWKGVKSDN